MLDTIFIENIPTQAVIGSHTFEKAAPQKLIISVELGTDITKVAKSDDLQFALDYDAISHFIDEYVQSSSVELLETLAENLVQVLFAHFAVQTIKLRLQKPGAIPYTQMVGVEIYRENNNATESH
ncbi:MAG: dihydroneopterin aldolase [Ostreibacterium sp.]